MSDIDSRRTRCRPQHIGSGRKAANIRTWLGLLSLLIILSGCKPAQPVYNTRFLAFGTLVDLSIIGVNKDTAQAASHALEQDFAYMHHTWHAWDPGPLGRVNQLLASGETFAMPPSALPLIKLGQKLAEQSGHLFNPAIGKLINLWGFHSDAPECRPPPDPAAISALVQANPRMSDLQLKGIMLHSNNRSVQLDFGAFGKGYGIDQAIAHLREMGIHNAIVNAGGDLRAIGDRDGRPWRIAIRNPNGGGVFAIIEVSGDESVFTSGDYERNFIYDGKSYHHIIDPRTGYPAEGSRSVTVLYENAVTADAAATALFVAGPESWRQVARNMGIRYVLLVDEAGTIHMTPAMARRIQFLEKNPDIRLSEPL
jgi:thiamine biosynthesis lipoprotein